jgi:hypothetical protein
VIAKIDGVQEDRAVILGNHRDAWVFGAADPNSGTATMLGKKELFLFCGYVQRWRGHLACYLN